MSRKRAIILILLSLFIFWLFSLPQQLFPEQYSTVMYDSQDNLLHARVAVDGQWRFAPNESIPENYRISLIHFEDRYFYYHPGFNPLAIARAFLQNVQSSKVKSGASTISMQVIRLSRKGRARTIWEKIAEIWLATRLELKYSKEEILQLYASHAPFGGNVVGLQAASWRYYGHRQEELSWAEAATLAVLPNSPSLIFPGRNQELLLQKRNRLLMVLHKRGFIDETTLQLSMAEPLPGKPHALPQHAPHLFLRAEADGLEGQQIFTTINSDLQKRTESILGRHHLNLKGNFVNNMAALVADVNTGQVLVYWGNAPETHGTVNAGQVDVISAHRSPGSLLKPFLYAGLLQEGQILPNSLVADIPTQFQGFNPENFARTYDGAVPASRALARSLNIPAVRMLMDYHPDKFLSLLKSCGLQTFNQPASHYGLSLILGGGEVTMWEIAGAYASMARSLNQWNYELENQLPSFYPLTYQKDETAKLLAGSASPFGAGVLWSTFSAMVEAARPDTESNWKYFSGQRQVAWKTGTSFGNRDAWAIGINPGYVVAVWIGNATGEGRPALTGIAAAAPVMFEIFGILPSQGWFAEPHEDLQPMRICSQSGLPASDHCSPIDTILVPYLDFQTGVCPYHQIVHLDKNTRLRVNSQCASLAEMEAHSWFVLPPVQEYYFRHRNPFYKTLPPFKAGCLDQQSNPMQWIYPTTTTAIYIPYELDGSAGEAIFRIAHRHERTKIHWHLNDEYKGSTLDFHEMALRPPAGMNTITVTDEDGNLLEKVIEVRMR
jgi:penicillin-binding protein 1C